MNIPNISPSRLATRDQCKRKETYSRCRERGPQHPAAAFGDEVHKVLETWLTAGAPPDPNTKAGKVATPGLALLPMPGTATVETKFKEQWNGVTYSGRIDFAYPTAPTSTVLVGDHKTTGNWAYIKTENDLLDDPQRIVYSAWAAFRFPDVEHIAAQWVYYHTKKPPKATSVLVVESRAHVLERFDHLHQTKALTLLADVHIPPEDMPRTISTLCNYCNHKPECWEGLAPAQIAAMQLSQIRR